MDRQTRSLLAIFAVGFGIVALALLGMLTYAPDVEPSPFDLPTPSPVATVVVTATPHHNANVYNMVNETEEEWSLCDPRHNATHLAYWKCEGCGGSGSVPQAAAHPVREAETITAVLFGGMALGLVLLIRRG